MKVKEIVPIDWIDKISGLTVAQAIEYLQTLNQNYILNCYIDGDTSWATLKSELFFKREESEDEAKLRIAENKARLWYSASNNVKDNEIKLEYYTNLGDVYSIKEYTVRLEIAKSKLKHLQDNT